MESISAAELEKFCYCPLSWSLAREQEVRSPALDRGRAEHAVLGDGLIDIVQKEEKAALYERVAVWTSLVASALAVLGAFLFISSDDLLRGQMLSAMALLCILLASILLYRSARYPDPTQAKGRERSMLFFALLGIITAFNAVPVFDVTVDLAFIYQIVSVLLLLMACFSLYLSYLSSERARLGRVGTGVEESIAYIGEGKEQGEVLRSAELGLTGRPDYVLETDEGLTPVEVKAGRTPRGPLFSHIVQLAAYCWLVEANMGKVPYGVIRYGERDFWIPYDEGLKATMRGKLDEMRTHIDGAPVHRDHQRSGKCRSCSRRELCPERLV